MHLPILFGAELKSLNEEMLFSLNSLEFSGDLNKPNGIYEPLNGIEKELCKRSEIVEVIDFLKHKYLLIRSKAKALQAERKPIGF